MLGNSIAMYNPPLALPRNSRCWISSRGGRLVAGFPVGSSIDNNFCYGGVAGHAARALLRGARSDKEGVDGERDRSHSRRYNKIRYVNLFPRPIQKPHPPIWIPGGGSMETSIATAANAYQYSYLSFFGYRHGRHVTDGYWHIAGPLPARKAIPTAWASRRFSPWPRARAAEREYGPHVDYFFNRCLHVFGGFAEAPGYRTLDSIKSGFLGQIGKQSTGFDAGGKKTWKDLVDQGYIIAGSPKTTRDRLTEAVKTLRCGHLMCLMQSVDAGAPGAQEHRTVRARGDAAHAWAVERIRRSMVAASAARRRARPPRRSRAGDGSPRGIQVKAIERIGGGRFSAEVYSFGSGEPLLFIHGAGGLFGSEAFLEDLGRDFRVTAPHLPGSDIASGNYDAVIVSHRSFEFRPVSDQLFNAAQAGRPPSKDSKS